MHRAVGRFSWKEQAACLGNYIMLLIILFLPYFSKILDIPWGPLGSLEFEARGLTVPSTPGALGKGEWASLPAARSVALQLICVAHCFLWLWHLATPRD